MLVDLLFWTTVGGVAGLLVVELIAMHRIVRPVALVCDILARKVRW